MSYRNPSDDIGEPPFNRGDVVISTNPKWTTMRAGRTIVVADCHWNRTRRRWIIGVQHPKFGFSNYDAQWFKLVHQEEKKEMHIAIDITDNKRLDDTQVVPILLRDESFVCQDKSLVNVKNTVRNLLSKNPERSYAIFSLAYIAEVEMPMPPVRFRDMR